MKTKSTTIKTGANWILITLREAAWAPLSVFGFYLFGLALDLFDLYPFLDIPTHFLGGAAITYLYCSAIRNSQKVFGEIPSPVQVIFAFTCTGTTIILWEFYENIMDYFLHMHMVLGLSDTLKDMFIGLLGALVLTLFYRKH
jgi:hypothetical protein